MLINPQRPASSSSSSSSLLDPSKISPLSKQQLITQLSRCAWLKLQRCTTAPNGKTCLELEIINLIQLLCPPSTRCQCSPVLASPLACISLRLNVPGSVRAIPTSPHSFTCTDLQLRHGPSSSRAGPAGQITARLPNGSSKADDSALGFPHAWTNSELANGAKCTLLQPASVTPASQRTLQV